MTLSLACCQKLIDLANAYDVIVFEDTPYRHIRFTGTTLPMLTSMDTQGQVTHLASFSKILVPGLRVGWAVAAPNFLEPMRLLKVAADTQTSTLKMATAILFLERYDLSTHIAGRCIAYRRKKDLMLTAIRQYFPQDVQMIDPKGGLFTWQLFHKALTQLPSCKMSLCLLPV
ncbi:MAG: aminotransferase class I/II-fold pyridoxal phosphate-dependent enzyme [Paracoccaceae bacterium]|nr:aminotransferase class I/II-fold pyridoxal phosphate-dependent enzyme [Paracoccaceae bacterium]